MKEALRQIEEALKRLEGKRKLIGKFAYEAIRLPLVSLRTLLEGDAGEDEKIILGRLEAQENGLKNRWGSKAAKRMIPAKAALSRLSAKAKIGEAEIREAKREALEATNDFMGEAYRDTDSIHVKRVVGVLDHYISDRIAEFTALKEAGK